MSRPLLGVPRYFRALPPELAAIVADECWLRLHRRWRDPSRYELGLQGEQLARVEHRRRSREWARKRRG